MMNDDLDTESDKDVHLPVTEKKDKGKVVAEKKFKRTLSNHDFNGITMIKVVDTEGKIYWSIKRVNDYLSSCSLRTFRLIGEKHANCKVSFIGVNVEKNIYFTTLQTIEDALSVRKSDEVDDLLSFLKENNTIENENTIKVVNEPKKRERKRKRFSDSESESEKKLLNIEGIPFALTEKNYIIAKNLCALYEAYIKLKESF